MILQHLGATCWFYFSLSNQSTFTLFRPSQEIIPTLVAVDLPALLSLSSSSWQGLTVFTSHVPSHVWLWMLMHRRRKKREEHQEYNGNDQVFFLSLVLVLCIMAGLRIYPEKKNGSGGRKGGKEMKLQSPSEWCISYIYIQTQAHKYIHTHMYKNT